jgi:hypothetical protein
MRVILHWGIMLSLLGLVEAAARADAPVARLDDDGMLVVPGRRTFVIGSYHNPGTAEGKRASLPRLCGADRPSCCRSGRPSGPSEAQHSLLSQDCSRAH